MSKTERFELRLDRDMIDRLDQWRGRQDDNPSRSEAARRLMERGLSEKVGISGGERLILTLLRDLHKHHDLVSEADPDFIMEAILGGHHWALEWEMQGLFHGSIDRKQTVREVVDYLGMWSLLEESYDGMSDADKKKIETETGRSGDVKFIGFDGNSETEHMGVARFLIEKMGRFERFNKRSLNSHSHSIEIYRRMYSAFEAIRKNVVGRTMSADEVIAVLNECVHPENR